MKKIVGISPWSPQENPDYELMREAGIEWVRATIPFPETQNYTAALKRIEKAYNAGMKVACVSPNPARYGRYNGNDYMDYRTVPESWGEFGSDFFHETSFRMCERIGKDTKDLVELWQVANEMDHHPFRGNMTMEEVGGYLEACAKGLKSGNSSKNLMLGINPAHIQSDEALYLYDRLYKKNTDLLTYVGGDGYFGSWSSGKVEDWPDIINYLYELTGYPVLINEWGYSSGGGEAWPQMKVNERPCNTGHFRYVWRRVHDEKEQAEYVSVGIRLILEHPHCMGFLYYSWGDDGTCWSCGKKGCPSESYWGITDGNNNPKEAYYAFKEAVLRYYKMEGYAKL